MSCANANASSVANVNPNIRYISIIFRRTNFGGCAVEISLYRPLNGSVSFERVMHFNLCFNLIKNTINHPATASLGTKLTSSLLYLDAEKDGRNFHRQEAHHAFRTAHAEARLVIILTKGTNVHYSLNGR